MSRTNTVKDEKGDLVAHSYSILARWRNHFSHLLNVHGVNGIRQTEVHTTQPQFSVSVHIKNYYNNTPICVSLPRDCPTGAQTASMLRFIYDAQPV